MINKLEDLILEGEKIEGKRGLGGMLIVAGVEFETWKAKSIIYLDQNKSGLNEYLVNEFKEQSKSSGSVTMNGYHKLLGILKAFKETQD